MVYQYTNSSYGYFDVGDVYGHLDHRKSSSPTLKVVKIKQCGGATHE